VAKLKSVQEENVQLERELQGQDAALRQVELQAAQLAEVETTATQLAAHNRMLQLQVEDAVAQGAALRKVCFACLHDVLCLTAQACTATVCACCFSTAEDMHG
jgi:hypothetical protein